MNPFSSAIEKLDFKKVLHHMGKYLVTEPGTALLDTIVPEVHAERIRHELACVSETKLHIEEEGFLPLEGVHTIASSLHRSGIDGSVLQPDELLRIRSSLVASRTLLSRIKPHRSSLPLLWEIVEPLFVDKIIEYNISQAIDDAGMIKDSASRELHSIRRSIHDRYDQLKKKLEGIIKQATSDGFSQDEIVTTREGRMVIPVKAEFKGHIPGFIHSASSSGATVFVEPAETLELNNEIRSLHFREQREIERILKELTHQVRACKDALLSNERTLARVDVLHAKAKYSIEILGAEPIITDSGGMHLYNARHPVLLMTHGYKSTVPLDLELGNEFTMLVISGPNAGGKTVAMKCVGLLVLMVQSGLHVPVAPHSVFRVVDTIFVDIGDDQSIENDLSTFSSHLRHLKQIAADADHNSLVLIDEIGSGTDPSEGGAIAAAFLETLAQRKALTIATTHHGALKVFAYETHGVENGAMEFNQKTLEPTYSFRPGIPGSSYALEMATRLGFSEDILQKARTYLGQQQTKLSDLVSELEELSQRHRSDLEALNSEKTRLDGLVSQYESRVKNQQKELRIVKLQAIEEARQIVDSANAIIERSIREIRESSAGKETVRHAKAEIELLRRQMDDELTQEHEEVPFVKPDLSVGSVVAVRGGTQSGEIISFSPDGNSAVVVFGNVKMKTPVRDLVAVADRRQSRPQTDGDLQRDRPAIPRHLDVRGMTGEEALPLVDKFIDDAILGGLFRIDIVHGKGTGALRKKVTDFLTGHPRVKAFHLAEWNEGGTGATVVELKEG